MDIKSVRRENLRALAESVGGIRQLAFKLNQSQSQLSQVIGVSATKNVGHKIATQVETVFDKPAGWLDTAQTARIGGKLTGYPTPDGKSAVLCRQVPRLTGKTVKHWHSVADDDQPTATDCLITAGVPVSQWAFALEIEEDSMQASSGLSLPVGAVLIADPEEVAKLGHYVIVALHPQSNAICRQWVSDGNKRYLKPLNPRYPLVEFKLDTLIYGVVKQVVFHLEV